MSHDNSDTRGPGEWFREPPPHIEFSCNRVLIPLFSHSLFEQIEYVCTHCVNNNLMNIYITCFVIDSRYPIVGRANRLPVKSVTSLLLSRQIK